MMAAAIFISLLSFLMFSRMGADFMPALNEGDLVINLTRDTQIGIDRSVDIQKQSEK